MLVSGELGAGKTTFVRGACRALGVTGVVTSPTYTIGQVYDAGDGHEVAHLDLYRLRSLEGEDPALLDDYLTPARIGFVEWPAVGEAGIERRRSRACGSSTPAATGACWGRVTIVGFDTSTAATSVCVLRADGEAFELVPAAGAAVRAAGALARAAARRSRA